MGQFYKNAAMREATLIRDLPLLDEEFDETLYLEEEHEYERELLAVPQPHHFYPSSRS